MEQKVTGRAKILLILLLAAGLFSSCSYRFYQAACEKPVAGPLRTLVKLDTLVDETSGLLYLDGNIWTFNDSHGEPALYAFDPLEGSVIRRTVIMNATNVDWEDIAEDSGWIYVADVGNNYGTRDTLLIYRISKNAVLSGEPALNHSGVISFSFNGDRSHDPSGRYSHDCEAMVAFEDSLYLFSKNWTDRSTSVFVVPKKPGHYSIEAVNRYPVNVLVTGADLDKERQELALVGYRNWIPVVIIYKYEGHPGTIECGGKARTYPMRTGRQVEGICYDKRGGLYISAERTFQKQALFKLGRRDP